MQQFIGGTQACQRLNLHWEAASPLAQVGQAPPAKREAIEAKLKSVLIAKRQHLNGIHRQQANVAPPAPGRKPYPPQRKGQIVRLRHRARSCEQLVTSSARSVKMAAACKAKHRVRELRHQCVGRRDPTISRGLARVIQPETALGIVARIRKAAQKQEDQPVARQPISSTNWLRDTWPSSRKSAARVSARSNSPRRDKWRNWPYITDKS